MSRYSGHVVSIQVAGNTIVYQTQTHFRFVKLYQAMISHRPFLHHLDDREYQELPIEIQILETYHECCDTTRGF